MAIINLNVSSRKHTVDVGPRTPVLWVRRDDLKLSGNNYGYDVVQWGAELLPMTHFLRLVRGVMLRGASLVELWPGVLALLAFTTITMTLAILRFRKRLD